MSTITLTELATKEVEESFRNDEEAHELLALIDVEFRSDPTSVQCFDLRVVDRVRICVERRRKYMARRGW